MADLRLPSQRNPELSTGLNTADNISRYLLEDGHRKWGFIIYRCTYDSESEWTEFISRLQHHIKHTLEFYNGLDLLESLDLTVIEDREALDDVEASVVREHFNTWVKNAPQREQNQAHPQIQSEDGIQIWESQRYLYCIQVDAEVLNSVVHWALAPPAIDVRSEGFLKIISRYWEPYGERDRDPPQEGLKGARKMMWVDDGGLYVFG